MMYIVECGLWVTGEQSVSSKKAKQLYFVWVVSRIASGKRFHHNTYFFHCHQLLTLRMMVARTDTAFVLVVSSTMRYGCCPLIGCRVHSCSLTLIMDLLIFTRLQCNTCKFYR